METNKWIYNWIKINKLYDNTIKETMIPKLVTFLNNSVKNKDFNSRIIVKVVLFVKSILNQNRIIQNSWPWCRKDNVQKFQTCWKPCFLLLFSRCKPLLQKKTSKMTSRRAKKLQKEAPGEPKWAPGAAQEAPGAPQEPPRRPQEPPQSLSKGLRGAAGSKVGAQRPPGSHFGAILAQFSTLRGIIFRGVRWFVPSIFAC